MTILFILALVGHILCGVCDCLLTYGKSGALDFKSMKDADKMSETFKDMPLNSPMISIVMGTFAITLFSYGYFGLAEWMGEYSHIASEIMAISAIVFLIPIVVHHVICGFVEWMYIRLGRTVEAREAVLEFQKKTNSTMIVGYIGLAVFVITLFVMIVSGNTPLPRWACVFNTLPAMIVLAPTKLPAKGNIAGMVMFLGLLFFIH